MKNLKAIRACWILALLCAVLGVAGCGDDNPPSGNIITVPVVNGITPSEVSLGQRNVEGRIQGQNLSGVVSVSLGASIAVHRFEVVSASEILVVFTVGRDAQPGARTITISTSAGTGTSAAIFTVQNNQVPVASFSIEPRTGSKNLEITFDASGSTDQGGKITKYEWDFGDGKVAAGKIVTHKYTKAGSFVVTLLITDNQQGANFTIREMEIDDNLPPVAKFTVSPGAGDTNTEFTFDGSTSTDSDGRIVRYQFDFGDGKKEEAKVVKHVFATDKTFTVTLTVTDNDNTKDVNEREVEVEKGHSGGGGGCKASVDAQSLCSGGFDGQQFCVVSVQGNTMIASTTLQRCPGKCGEVRRRADGIREFVGDIDRIDGNRVTLDYGHLPATTRPKPGERLKAIWRPCH